MRFGLSIPTLTGFARGAGPARAWRERYERAYEICARAEELGFTLGTIGQHRFTPGYVDSSAPLVSLAAVAARTSTLRLCTNILLLPTHDPLEIAEQAAVLDEVSDGRLVLGVGIGYRPYEFDKIGLDYRRRAARAEAAIDVLRRAWSGKPVVVDGEFFRIDGPEVAPAPVQDAGPPIWIGARADAAVARAARVGDGWLTDNTESVLSLGPKIARYRKAAASHGRPHDVALNRRVGIADSRRSVEDGWLQRYAETIRRYLDSGLTFDDPSFVETVTSGERRTLADIPAGRLIAGDPDDCIQAVELCASATDADYIVCDFGRGAHGADYQRLSKSIELFGREVMPAFR
jgi:probable F420-dependent oxidoreductase